MSVQYIYLAYHHHMQLQKSHQEGHGYFTAETPIPSVVSASKPTIPVVPQGRDRRQVKRTRYVLQW